MEAAVLNIKGQDTGRKVTLNENIYGIKPNDHAIYLDVKQYLANKLGRQKGGGGARRGDINSPVLVGGGRVFGPTPRDYGFKLNKKLKALARRSALSYKAQEQAIVVVEDFTIETPKTKEFLEILNNLKIAGKKTLVVTPGANKNVFLSSRNVQRTGVIMASSLNTYKVMDAEVLVMKESSLAQIDEILK